MKVYVIATPGIGYNDEYHYIGGEDDSVGVAHEGWADKAKAKAACVDKIRDELSHYNINDWGEWYIDEPLIQEYLMTLGLDPKDHWDWNLEVKWTDFITWCEMLNKPWIQSVPQMWEVHEVEFFPGQK